MWPVIVAGIAGAWWASQGRPKTRVKPSTVTGAKSGREWRTEYIPDLEMLVVHGVAARVAFQRTEAGWVGRRASGNPSEVALIRKDFEDGRNE